MTADFLNRWLDAQTCERLASALGHFVWQAALIGVVAEIANRAFARSSSRTRYSMQLMFLIAMAVCVPLTLAVNKTSEREVLEPPVAVEGTIASTEVQIRQDTERSAALEPNAGGTPAAAQEASASGTTKAPTTVILSPVADPEPTPFATQIVIAWIACALLLVLRLVVAMLGGWRLMRAANQVTQPSVRILFDRAVRAIGLRAAPGLLWCERVAVPVVVGIIRPTILLPPSLLTGLEPEQLEAILAHELAHIRRLDPIVNVFQRLVESVLFFHPAVWLVSRQVSHERELCCDDLVLQQGTTRLAYANALVRMAEVCRQQQLAIGLAATGNSPTGFRHRILRLVVPEHQVRTGDRGLVAAICLIAIALLRPALALLPQQESEPQAGHPEGLIAVLGEDRARYWGHTMDLHLTPDEKRLYLTESLGFVSAFDTKTLKRVLQFRPHKQRCLDIVLMDSGRKLVSVSLDGTVAMWDVTASPPKLLRRTTMLPNNQRIWMNLSASSGTDRFAVQCMDFEKHNQGRFVVFDVREDSFVERADLSDSLGRKDHSRFAISPDGRWLASCEVTEGFEIVENSLGRHGHRNAEIVIRDLDSDGAKVVSRTARKVLERLQFSPDGQLWATDLDFLEKRKDYRWQLKAGTLGDPKVLTGSNDSIRRSFTDTATAAVAQDMKSIVISRTSDNEPVDTVNASPNRFTGAAALLKDGSLIVTSGPMLQRWDKVGDSYESQPLPTGHQSSVSGLMYDPQTNSLLTSAGGPLREWKLDGISPGKQLRSTELPFKGGGMRLWPGRKGFLFIEPAEKQQTVTGVRRAGNKMLTRFKLPIENADRMYVWSIAMHPTEPILATAHQDAKIRTWDVGGSKPKQIAEWVGHQTHACTLEFSPDGNHLYSGGWDHKTFRWTSDDSWQSASDTKKLMTTHEDFVRSVACSGDGRFLATGGEDGQILLRDEENPGEPKSLMHPGDPKPRKNSNAPRTPGSLQFSRDGKRLLSADGGGRVTIWTVPSGKIEKIWQLAGWIRSAQFVSEETMVATANYDGTVFILETPERD